MEAIRKEHETVNETLKGIIRDQCLRHGRYTLTNGKKSDFYVNIKEVCLDAVFLDLVSRSIRLMIERMGIVFNAVGGPVTGSLPILAALQMELRDQHELSGSISNLPKGFFVRAKSRMHGTSAWIEGRTITNEDNVLIVDDVSSSGSSLVDCITAVHGKGARIQAVITVLDRDEGTEDVMKTLDVPFYPIFSIKDVIDR